LIKLEHFVQIPGEGLFGMGNVVGEKQVWDVVGGEEVEGLR
jgi:hypothetical protein